MTGQRERIEALTKRFRAIRERSGLAECPECEWLVTGEVECNMCGAELR